ncbi:MAG: DNA primase [Candidatus Nanoarchaeia archaeon]
MTQRYESYKVAALHEEAKRYIYDIVKNYVPKLEKSGKDWKAICPRHDEKEPSYYVSPRRGIANCFGGCEEISGGAVKIVMAFEKIGYTEALERVAEYIGFDLGKRIDITPEEEENEKQEKSDRERRLNLNASAAKFFHEQLYRNSAALSYLIEERGITEESIETFNIGYHPYGGRQLINHLTDIGYSLDDMLHLGLVNESDDYGYTEPFRNRIIFPICNESGKILGFGGRKLDNDNNEKNPKYYNSKESSIFRKNHIVYGLNWANELIKKTKQEKVAYLEEGYTDVILSQQNGIPGVATMGTTLSDEALSLLSRFFKECVIVRDADPAGQGQERAKKDFYLLVENDIPASALLLPRDFSGKKEDPASFLQKYGPQEFFKLPRHDLIDFYVLITDINTIYKKIDAADYLLEEFKFIKDPMEKYLWLNKLEKILNIPQSMLTNRIVENVREESKRRIEVDYFSTNYINGIAAKYVAKLLTSPHSFSKAQLREVPVNLIPKDGSVFSEPVLKLYRRIIEEFKEDNYELSLFEKNIAPEMPSLFGPTMEDEIHLRSRTLLINSYHEIWTAIQNDKQHSWNFKKTKNLLRENLFVSQFNKLLDQIIEAHMENNDERARLFAAKLEKLHNTF